MLIWSIKKTSHQNSLSKSPLDLSKRAVALYGTSQQLHLHMVCITHKKQVNLGEGHYIIFDIIENNKTH